MKALYLSIYTHPSMVFHALTLTVDVLTESVDVTSCSTIPFCQRLQGSTKIQLQNAPPNGILHTSDVWVREQLLVRLHPKSNRLQ